MRLAPIVRAEMAARQMTPEELSIAADFPLDSLMAWLDGQESILVDDLFIVARALGVGIAELVSRAETLGPQLGSGQRPRSG